MRRSRAVAPLLKAAEKKRPPSNRSASAKGRLCRPLVCHPLQGESRQGVLIWWRFMSAAEPIRLIIGLGNPGPEYEATRHNAGFWLADQIADDMGASLSLDKSFSAWVAKGRHAGEAVIIAKPITYMNRSGQ